MTDKPVKASSVLPNPPRLLRALLSAVPTVGGPLDHLIFGQMTYFQINLLSTINKIPARTKTIDTQGHLVERLERQVTAIMIKDIQDEVQKDSIASEEVDLLMELDIIESLKELQTLFPKTRKDRTYLTPK